MQSTYHFIFSGLTGVVLVLASCVLMAPLLAILVATACVGVAWVSLRLNACLRACCREELRALGDDPVSALESLEP